MDREYRFLCDNCDSAFTIITEEQEKPTTCPFCGEALDEHEEDEIDDWDIE